jgi:hypothetical protein
MFSLYLTITLTFQQRKRRLRLIDKLAYAVGMEARNNLGDWIRRRITKVEDDRKEARQVLKDCGTSIEELQLLWKEQREAQMSIRSCTFTHVLQMAIQLTSYLQSVPRV